MAIEEKEDQELTKLQDLIDLVEKDPLPTNVFTIEDTDPLVLLGKLNEIEEYLRGIKSLIVDINSKSMEAVNTALDAIKVAKQALEGSNTALASANTALETANQAITTANTSLEQATDANNTAGDALVEADDAKQLAQTAMNKAQEALDQVTQGLGTKVYDNHGNLLNSAKFAGHNGINVDMAEDDPQTFDIRLDNTITTAIEDTHQQTETNKANITAVEGRVTNNEADIVELTNMLSATEELAQQATEALPNKLNKTGDTMTGILKFISQSLPVNNNMQYFLGIKSFAEGGDTNYISLPNLKTLLGLNGDYLPVYPQAQYDLNVLYDAGVYLIGNGYNSPTGTGYGVAIVLPYRKATGNTKPDFVVQIFIPNGDDPTNPNGLLWRTSESEQWHPWQDAQPKIKVTTTELYRGQADTAGMRPITSLDMDNYDFVIVEAYNSDYERLPLIFTAQTMQTTYVSGEGKYLWDMSTANSSRWVYASWRKLSSTGNKFSLTIGGSSGGTFIGLIYGIKIGG